MDGHPEPLGRGCREPRRDEDARPGRGHETAPALEQESRLRYEEEQQRFELDRLLAASRAEEAEREIKNKLKEGGTDEERLRDLAAQAVAAQQIEPPGQKRYVINDATIEKLGEVLQDNPDGLLVFRDELMGLLRGLDKAGREQDRAFYLEGWNGEGQFTFDRIARGTKFIPAVCLSILGGIQPGPLSDYFRAAAKSGKDHDGLISRFQLLVYPDAMGG